MPMAEREEIVLVVCSAFIARKDVMDIEHGGALTAEETAATAKAIALEDALSDLGRQFHNRSRAHIAALIGWQTACSREHLIKQPEQGAEEQ